MTFFRSFTTRMAGLAGVAAVLATLPNGASAQDAPDPNTVCDVQEGTPRELGQAFVTLQNAMNDTGSENRLKNTKAAIKQAATNIERGQNLIGRDYVTAKSIMLMLHVPEVNPMTTRGELGYQTLLNEPVDLVAAADSLFNKVEAANPKCATEIQDWRFSQPFIDILTEATNALALDSLAKAKRLATRAQLLERKTPYSWQILASIATREENEADAMQYWQKTLDAAGDDSTTREVKMQAIYFLGETQLHAAGRESGAAAAGKAREAAKYFQQFVAADAHHKDSPAARSNLAEAYMMSGDTARVPSVYADLIANPTQYDAQSHLQAGVVASRLERNEDAVKLFGAALQTAPYDRDALFNLSVSLFSAQNFEEMVPIAGRLVQVDPNHPDNLQMLAYAYAMVEPKETDPAKKKMYADSLAKYQELFNATSESHRVEYSVFQKGESSTALTGRVYNLGKEPKNFTLQIDFLDANGNVVDSGTATVSAVAPDGSGRFEVKVERGGISYFKSKPIPIPPM